MLKGFEADLRRYYAEHHEALNDNYMPWEAFWAENVPVRLTPIIKNEKLNKALLACIAKEAKPQATPKAKGPKPFDGDYGVLAGEPYAATLGELLIPVGKVGDGSHHQFCLDLQEHVHAFVLGMSGSGKSVLLHDIIMGATARYAPEDLMLYLLDLKLGGVEFNRYRELPHLQALLVDNSDARITLEVLRDLMQMMTERGRRLRAAEATSIESYNRQHPDERLPQVMVVVDECHELFTTHGNRDNNATMNEIADILARVAKEGRSQGVHLVLSTQTLSKAEIPNDIIHNISEHYLLKCAEADAERMVRDSSKLTAQLKKGDIAYFGPDGTHQLHSFFTPDDQVKPTVASLVRKAKGHAAHARFYFSGSQTFPLTRKELQAAARASRKHPLAALGCSVSLARTPIRIAFRQDLGQNMLLFGINSTQQMTRLTLCALLSLQASLRSMKRPAQVCVLDFLDTDETAFGPLLARLADADDFTLVPRQEQGALLRRLAARLEANDRQPADAADVLLAVIGQERWRELRFDTPLPAAESASPAAAPSADNPFAGLSFGAPQKPAGPQTFREAMTAILEQGPAAGIHTLLQIDSPANLLGEDYVSARSVMSRFSHIVIGRTDAKAALTLSLPDEIRPDRLPADEDRPRAYYYAAEDNTHILFTPYTGVESIEP